MPDIDLDYPAIISGKTILMGLFPKKLVTNRFNKNFIPVRYHRLIDIINEFADLVMDSVANKQIKAIHYGKNFSAHTFHREDLFTWFHSSGTYKRLLGYDSPTNYEYQISDPIENQPGFREIERMVNLIYAETQKTNKFLNEKSDTSIKKAGPGRPPFVVTKPFINAVIALKRKGFKKKDIPFEKSIIDVIAPGIDYLGKGISKEEYQQEYGYAVSTVYHYAKNAWDYDDIHKT